MPRYLVTGILLVMVSASVSRAQSISTDVTIEELQDYKLRADQLVEQLRLEIRAALPPELRIKERAVRYEVLVNRWSVNSSIWLRHAAPTPVPTVNLDAQLIEAFDWIAEALAIDLRLQGHSCTVDYLTYLSSALSERISLSYGYDPPKVPVASKVFSPDDFFVRRKDICPTENLSALRTDSAVLVLRDLFLRSSLKLVMAHEFAHVALGHFAPSNSLADSRRKESEADEFAMNNLALSGTDPAEAMPGAVLWMLLDRSNGDDSLSTHPSGLRRLSLLINAAERAEFLNPQLAISGEWQGMDPNWGKGTKAVLDRARQRMVIEALRSRCPECVHNSSTQP